MYAVYSGLEPEAAYALYCCMLDGEGAMTPADDFYFRPQILERQRMLEAAADRLPDDYVESLLSEIDSALQRIDDGSYGLCETCHEPIEPERLLADPMVCFCLEHLSTKEIKELEGDLELASQIQGKLLPPRGLQMAGWETNYLYRPAGPVSGDYCELMPVEDGGTLFFAVGDVAGKGMAASLLMTHLNAILRSLITLNLPLEDLMSRANRLFCESTLASHYATLVCGRAQSDGRLEICNAGHCPAIIARGDGIAEIQAAGLPLGLFCHSEYQTQCMTLQPEEVLVLYSDGVTEARDPDGEEFAVNRLMDTIRQSCGHGPKGLTAAVAGEHVAFRRGVAPMDDLTLLVLRRQ